MADEDSPMQPSRPALPKIPPKLPPVPSKPIAVAPPQAHTESESAPVELVGTPKDPPPPRRGTLAISENVKNIAFALPGMVPPVKRPAVVSEDDPIANPPSSTTPLMLISNTEIRASGAKGRKRPTRKAPQNFAAPPPITIDESQPQETTTAQKSVPNTGVLADDDDEELEKLLSAAQPSILRPQSYRLSTAVSQQNHQQQHAQQNPPQNPAAIDNTEGGKNAQISANSRKSGWWDVTTTSTVAESTAPTTTVDIATTLHALVQQLQRDHLLRTQISNNLATARAALALSVERAKLADSVKAALHPPTEPSELERELIRIQNHTNLSGWMEKESGLFKTWKKRWFVLKCTSLAYFDTPESKTPKAELNLDAEHGVRITISNNVEAVREVVTVDISLDNNSNKRLVFSGPEKDMQMWAQAITAKNASLVYLRRKRDGGGEVQPKVLRFMHDETETDFSFPNTTLGADECKCMCTMLNYHPNILNLNLEKTKLTDENLRLLMIDSGSFHPHIHTLNLAGNLLTRSGVTLLANMLAFQNKPLELKWLDLSHNAIGDEGCSVLSHSLLSPPTTNNNTKNNTNTGNHSVSNLTYLSLNGCGISDEGGSVFVSALKNALERPGFTFPQIELAENKIGDKTVVMLVDIVAKLRVSSLNLASNQIGDRGMNAIATAILEPSTQITKLFIQDNKNASQKALGHVSRAVMACPRLETAWVTNSCKLNNVSLAALRMIHTATVGANADS